MSSRLSPTTSIPHSAAGANPSPLPETFNGKGLVSHLGHQGPSSLVLPPHLPLSMDFQKGALCSPTSGLPCLLFSPTQIPQEASLCWNQGQHFPCVSLTTCCSLTCPVMGLTVPTSAVSSVGSGTMSILYRVTAVLHSLAHRVACSRRSNHYNQIFSCYLCYKIFQQEK